MSGPHRPAYIAGVTNPIFESSRAWDLLLDIGNGTVTVAKDIHNTYPTTSGSAFSGGALISRAGTLKAESSLGSEDDIGRGGGGGGAKTDFVAKVDNNADNLFMEDVSLRPCVFFFMFCFDFSSFISLLIASCHSSRSGQLSSTITAKIMSVSGLSTLR